MGVESALAQADALRAVRFGPDFQSLIIDPAPRARGEHPTGLGQAAEQLDALQDAEAEVDRLLARPAADRSLAAAGLTSPTLAQLRAALCPGDLLLDYFLLDRLAVVFILDDVGRLEIAPLDSARIERWGNEGLRVVKRLRSLGAFEDGVEC